MKPLGPHNPMRGLDTGDPAIKIKLDNCAGIDAHEKANLWAKYMNACYLDGRDSDSAKERALNIAIRISEENQKWRG